jgi:hypothetical protein
VSLSWRDEIGIHLSPARLLLLRVGGGLRGRRVIAQHEQAMDEVRFNDWTEPMAVLGQMLERAEWQNAPVRVVVADCWVRYALVPWAADLGSAVEQISHARQVLIRLYGNAVSEWRICLSQAPPGVARVACAMPTELLDAIRDIHAKHAARLVSLQPHLLVAYSNWRLQLPTEGAWFVTIGEGTLAAARLGPRSWDRIHNIRIGTDWTRDLKRLQIFGRLASARPDEGQVYVDAPAAWREVAGPAAQDLHWLEKDADPGTTLQQLGRMRRLAA